MFIRGIIMSWFYNLACDGNLITGKLTLDINWYIFIVFFRIYLKYSIIKKY